MKDSVLYYLLKPQILKEFLVSTTIFLILEFIILFYCIVILTLIYFLCIYTCFILLKI